jgi:ferredoxin
MVSTNTGARARVVVDRARCTGIGICESIAPDVFEVGEDGAMALLVEEVDASDGTVEDAVHACPAMALSLVRE